MQARVAPICTAGENQRDSECNHVRLKNAIGGRAMARILCLDDELEILKLYRLILERAGHECLAANSDERALSIMRTQSIDLLTQDWHRPGTNGLEFLRVMKSDEALRNIPVLFITAGQKEKRAEQLKQVGLDMDRDVAGYITKPITPTELLNTVEAILEKHSKPSPPE
jgi:CheY-like chemotaxis protein